jgi:hypothetical protein
MVIQTQDQVPSFHYLCALTSSLISHLQNTFAVRGVPHNFVPSSIGQKNVSEQDDSFRQQIPPHSLRPLLVTVIGITLDKNMYGNSKNKTG